MDPVVFPPPSRVDLLSTATGVADPMNSSPPARIPSSLRPLLVRIRRRRRWEGRIQRRLPLPHVSRLLSARLSRGSIGGGDGRGVPASSSPPARIPLSLRASDNRRGGAGSLPTAVSSSHCRIALPEQY
uniref:Uncharacterized protein n=1 Tax=Oryza punctata TaxID=4537 RepID=A0A0E0JKA2_ORYPU